MKTINTYITEKLHINKNVKTYKYFPKTKDELISDILDKIDKEGLGTENKPLDLNDICTSEITDMSGLFNYNGALKELSDKVNFVISDWDVHNVTDMSYMFAGSNFDGDLSGWNTSKVKDMSGMFSGSEFTDKNGDLSDWDVSSVENMYAMFCRSIFDGDISKWNVSKVENMNSMFFGSAFTGKNGNISRWDVSNVKSMYDIFSWCPLEKNPPKWYKS